MFRWIAVAITALFSFSCFNAIWIIETGYYDVFVQPVMWAWVTLASLLIALPVVLTGKSLISFILLLTTDLVMISNLMYLSEFGTQIPIGCYQNISNLIDFTDALPSTMSWQMILFPIFLIGLWLTLKLLPPRQDQSHRRIYFLTLCMAIIFMGITMLYPERVDKRVADLRKSHGLHATITSLFSLTANWIAQWQTTKKVINDKDRKKVDSFISSRMAMLHGIAGATIPSRFIFIMMESMESWPIGANINGREITPCINRLIADSLKVLYAPKVIPEVGGGRSADAQLIDLCGLLPPDGEMYTFSFPGSKYPSIISLFKEVYQSETAMLTLDSPNTYNVRVMHRSMGFDTLFTRKSYFRDHGSRSDSLLLASAANILFSGEHPLWQNKESGAAMIVTYSCHVPFRFPHDIEVAPYPENLPVKLARYLRTVSYTDAAVGRFIDSLRATSECDRTIIVLTGDHNAFGPKERMHLSEAVDIVGAEPYIPLVVLNSPVAGVIDREIPQSDIYTTLLQLSGLICKVKWPGVGKSFLFPYTADLDDDAMRHEVSDLIIRYDLLR